ncbi:MAG TPA: response regulator [Armatimonadetes bacterium]|nr:response regulator [Armatimonadota bacterium]
MSAKAAVSILVADPDPFSVELVRKALQPEYTLDVVRDGPTALEKARNCSPALVIAEILLPRLDGFQLCRCLKEDTATASIPILVLSFLRAEERARQAGADAFLLKPLQPELVRQTVAELIAAGEGNIRHEIC